MLLWEPFLVSPQKPQKLRELQHSVRPIMEGAKLRPNDHTSHDFVTWNRPPDDSNNPLTISFRTTPRISKIVVTLLFLK